MYEVYARQLYNRAPRKLQIVKCRGGGQVVSGGYILAGAFQTFGGPAPKVVPTVTENHAVQSDGGGYIGWEVIAIAPSNFVGVWGLQARAMCQ